MDQFIGGIGIFRGKYLDGQLQVGFKDVLPYQFQIVLVTKGEIWESEYPTGFNS